MSATGTSRLAALRGSNNEGVLALILVVLVIAMTIVNSDFLSAGTLFAILRSSIVPTVLALGVLIVIISGGIDVSFPAIAIFSAYTTVVLMRGSGIDAGVVLVLVVSLVIGALLGLVNGGLIARFKLPTLIVTLGTQGIFKGILIAYVGSRYIAELPLGMRMFSTQSLLTVPAGGENTSLHVLVVPAIVLCLLVNFLLRNTMFGRGVYAIGNDTEAARRVGFSVMRIQVILYVVAGVLAAFGGVLHVTLTRSANPQDLLGTELDTIAAVVLGGASIFGGRGSVLGTMLGVLLIQVINNSLILMGIPSAWQRTAVGLLLVIGVGVQAISARRSSRRVFAHREVVAPA
ncbi:ABC transporter permease [Cryobacterium tepidiphilum]|uniref:ABC transporter permease n=1 Tax=Cryobacterium tepidiphilum TaxID=2486026 RepID=A0A3M8LFC5_9MICO|nr:ABC transporter permease [Cryobacterium tepidiphilum]RNE64171.1 ABC transporter permease [Cryobacterium tepidiphilum]